MLPPAATTPEELQDKLQSIKDEHDRLVSEISTAKDWLSHHEVQKKQLQDFSEHLAKEHTRIKDWESGVTTRENNIQGTVKQLNDLMDEYSKKLSSDQHKDLPQQPKHHILVVEPGQIGAKVF